ncbi:hypothetical protein ACFL6A_01400 [bacterium]
MIRKKLLIIIGLGIFILRCAAPGGKFIVQDPQEGLSLLVGAILVENDGVDDLYHPITSKITVVVVGKPIGSSGEEAKGYRIKTDKNGYFAIQNLPPGSYIIKGIELDVGYVNRMLIGSLWEGKWHRYVPVRTMIDYTVRYWPEEIQEKVIDLGIHYFKIDNAMRIYHDRFEVLENVKLGLKDVVHTMKNPKTYFGEQYPDLKWLQSD